MIDDLPELIETRRLVLRPIREQDADQLARCLSDWEVARWMSVIPWPYGPDQAREWVENAHRRRLARERLDMVAEPRAGGGIVGSVGIGLEKRVIGYWVAREEWRRGYGSEMLLGALGFAFGPLQFPEIRAFVDTRNGASQDLLRKLGMRHIGQRERSANPRGFTGMADVFEMSAAEWAGREPTP
jgi:RimJ/RimL family protein N-acetyltransferase